MQSRGTSYRTGTLGFLCSIGLPNEQMSENRDQAIKSFGQTSAVPTQEGITSSLAYHEDHQPSSQTKMNQEEEDVEEEEEEEEVLWLYIHIIEETCSISFMLLCSDCALFSIQNISIFVCVWPGGAIILKSYNNLEL